MGGINGRTIKSFKIMGCRALEQAVETAKASMDTANIRAIWAIDLDSVIYLLYRR